MTTAQQTQRNYCNLVPVFHITTPHDAHAQLSLLEEKLELLAKEVHVIPNDRGGIKTTTLPVRVEDTERGYVIEPLYSHTIKEVSTGTGSNAKITVSNPEFTYIWIGKDAYKVFFAEQKKA